MSAIRDLKRIVTDWLPPLAGVGLIALFVALANWQLDRAAQKEALAAMFDENAPAVELRAGESYALFTPLTVRGRYLSDRQFLIDNIISNSRVGYNVITPLEADDGRLYLVNRGWLAQEAHGSTAPVIAVGSEMRELRARAGRLPRVGLRPDVSVEAGQSWPKHTVYPRMSDLEAELQQDVSPPLLLLDAAADDGFERNWQPPENGSRMHYGYAFQWSALALTVLVILVWQLRKRARARNN